MRCRTHRYMIAAEYYGIEQIVLVVNKFDLPDSDVLFKVDSTPTCMVFTCCQCVPTYSGLIIEIHTCKHVLVAWPHDLEILSVLGSAPLLVSAPRALAAPRKRLWVRSVWPPRLAGETPRQDVNIRRTERRGKVQSH